MIADHNILISYFSAGIPPPLMKRIMSMDTVPTNVEEWYLKTIHFQTQWEWAEEISQRNCQPIKTTYYSCSSPPSSKTCDPDAMDVDIIKISKLTPDERKWCIEKGYISAAERQDTLAPLAPPSPPQLRKFDESNVMKNQRNTSPPYEK